MSKLNSPLNEPLNGKVIKESSIPLLSKTRFTTWSEKIQKPKSVTEETSIFFNACFDKGHVKELVSWFLNQCWHQFDGSSISMVFKSIW